MNKKLVEDLFRSKPSYLKESAETVIKRLNIEYVFDKEYKDYINQIIEIRKKIKKELKFKKTLESHSRIQPLNITTQKSWEGLSTSVNLKIQPLQPYLNGNPDNVLVISDLHIPAIVNNALEFCRSTQQKYNCGKVIFLGDLTDMYNNSRFPKNPDYRLSPLMELEKAKLELNKWYEIFPQATVLTSNHDSRVFKQAQLAQIPTTWLKDLKDILGVPNWEFIPEYEYNKILYFHGEADTAKKVAIHHNKSCIQGHRHSECYIDYVKKGVFGCQAGTLVDRKSMVFDYAKHQLKEWINSVVVVLNQQPIIVQYDN